jgi:hypothetical protein
VRFLPLLLIAALASCGAGTSLPLTINVVGQGGDPTSGVLPAYNDASPNWANAGMAKLGGIPVRTTVCATVFPSGGDDAANIKAAIAACPVGQVVMLNQGLGIMRADEPIHVAKGITVRGAGTCAGNVSSYPAPLCQGAVTVLDGITAYSSDQCGLPGGATTACPNGGPAVFDISPVSPAYNYSWAKCGNIGPSTGVSCGALPLTVDAAQGQTTVQLSSTTGIAVGSWVLIDEASGAGWVPDPITAQTGFGNVWAASDWLSPSGAPATGRVLWSKGQNANWDFGASALPSQGNGPGCYHSYCDRPTAELHKVVSVTPTSVTFDSPLTVAFRVGHTAQVYPALYPNQSGTGTPTQFVQQASIENLSILRAPNGGISMEFCAYCWLSNVDVGEWYGGGIVISNSARVELNGVYVHHCWDSVNSGGEYGMELRAASTEVLVTNSVTAFAGKSFVARAGGAGSVISYSVFDDTMYDARSGIGDSWVETDVDGGHYSGPHHMLFEGNWSNNLESDDTHGNANYLTFFRNWATGLRTPFTDPSNGKSVNDAAGGGSPLRTAGPMAYNYWFAFVGNYLGTPSVTVPANGWTYQGDFTGKRIWMLGWNSGIGKGGSGVDPNSPAMTFRHGNFDTVTNGVTWDANTPDHTLPPSFYLTQPPAFFSAGKGYAWPWVTPNGPAPLATLPAKARWDAGTPFQQP